MQSRKVKHDIKISVIAKFNYHTCLFKTFQNSRIESCIFKIRINTLGLIRNGTIEFSPFLIFSRDSNLGKSYTAFLFQHLLSLLEFKSDKSE